MKRAVTLLIMLISSFALTQENAITDAMYDLIAVAKLNQGSFVPDSTRATLRFGERIVYVFPNSFEVIVDGQDIRLNAPVLLREKRWLAPRVMLEALQLKVPAPMPSQANLSQFELEWEELEIKPKIFGLHLFYTSDFNSTNDASIFLMPFEQVSSLDKDSQSAVSQVIANFNLGQAGKILFFSVALEPSGNPVGQLDFIQGSTRYSVENGAGLYSFYGTFPETSLGAIKLPTSFNLRLPIRVVWGNSSADYVFI